MKRIVTFLLLAFALMLGTQSVSAQEKEPATSIAKKKTIELKAALALDNDQVGKVYELIKGYVENDQKYAAKAKDKGAKAPSKEKLKEALIANLEQLLTEEQVKKLSTSSVNVID